MNFEIDEATGLMLRLMQKKEPLRSDLWAYLDHNAPASEGLVLQHPLLHAVGVKMDGAAWINHLVQTAEKTAARALAEERWLDYALLHEPSHRLATFTKLAKRIPDAMYWQILGVLYVKTESIWQQKRQLARHFASDRPHRKQLMSAYERRYLARLPNRLTIFRGTHSKRVHGWSWTLTEKKALWLARRRNATKIANSHLATGTAKKSDALAYFSRRKEKEIVIDPSKVKIVTIKKVPKKGSL